MSEDPHTQGDTRVLAKRDVKFAATVVVVATVVLSFTALRDLARKCGFEHGLDWVWPICLDAVAYLATRIWLSKSGAWKFARALAIGAVALSLVANGLVHGMKSQPHWTIIVLVGAVPPLMLALVIHMLVADIPVNEPPKPVKIKATRKPAVKTESEIVTPAEVAVPEQATAGVSATSISQDMHKAGWAPGDYTTAKAAMHGYLTKVNADVTGADLEKIVGKFFKITSGTGVGRRAVRDYKAAVAAANQN